MEWEEEAHQCGLRIDDEEIKSSENDEGYWN
jgi:hypothetical protein